MTAVHDGDTITVDIDLGLRVWLRDQKVRLAEIDAPEVTGNTKVLGLASRNHLSSRIMTRTIRLQTIKDPRDKYGRWLARVFDNDGVCVNDEMIEKGFAKPLSYA